MGNLLSGMGHEMNSDGVTGSTRYLSAAVAIVVTDVFAVGVDVRAAVRRDALLQLHDLEAALRRFLALFLRLLQHFFARFHEEPPFEIGTGNELLTAWAILRARQKRDGVLPRAAMVATVPAPVLVGVGWCDPLLQLHDLETPRPLFFALFGGLLQLFVAGLHG